MEQLKLFLQKTKRAILGVVTRRTMIMIIAITVMIKVVIVITKIKTRLVEFIRKLKVKDNYVALSSHQP